MNYGLIEEDFEKTSPIEKDFEIIGYVEDHRFGNIGLLQDQSDNSSLLMLKEKFSKNFAECEMDIYQAKERKNLIHPNLLFMPDFSTHIIHQEDQSQEFLISGYYEYPDWDLEREIERKKEKNIFFEPEKLLRLIEDILSCLTYLQSKKMLHGDIRPKYIVLEKNDSPFKLADRLGDPHPPNKVQINNLKLNKKIYMAPVLFKSFTLRKRKIRHNPYKSDAFSLGIILLEAGLLESVQDIYNFEEKNIKIESLIEFIEKFMDRYGNHELLRESLIWMLDLEDSSRRDPKRLLEEFLELKSKLYEVNPDNQSQEEEEEQEQEQEVQLENVEQEKLNLEQEYREEEVNQEEKPIPEIYEENNDVIHNDQEQIDYQEEEIVEQEQDQREEFITNEVEDYPIEQLEPVEKFPEFTQNIEQHELLPQKIEVKVIDTNPYENLMQNYNQTNQPVVEEKPQKIKEFQSTPQKYQFANNYVVKLTGQINTNFQDFSNNKDNIKLHEEQVGKKIYLDQSRERVIQSEKVMVKPNFQEKEQIDRLDKSGLKFDFQNPPIKVGVDPEILISKNPQENNWTQVKTGSHDHKVVYQKYPSTTQTKQIKKLNLLEEKPQFPHQTKSDKYMQNLGFKLSQYNSSKMNPLNTKISFPSQQNQRQSTTISKAEYLNHPKRNFRVVQARNTSSFRSNEQTNIYNEKKQNSRRFRRDKPTINSSNEINRVSINSSKKDRSSIGVATRELYVSPSRFRVIRDSVNKQLIKEEMPKTFDYQVSQDNKQNTRRYVLSRKKQSFLNSFKDSEINSRDQNIYNQNNQVEQNSNSELMKRYQGELEIVQNNENFQVFRLKDSNARMGSKIDYTSNNVIYKSIPTRGDNFTHSQYQPTLPIK